MSYWIGLSEEKQKQYEAEFRGKALYNHIMNAFKVQNCLSCDQIVVMKLINDPLSNSSMLVYAGKCCNGHWNQEIPSTPRDIRKIPRCKICKSFMQWKMSREYNGWFCPQDGPPKW